jgi:hypothetical protein
MATDSGTTPEITSFNLADLDIRALDNRLELTTMLPQYIICEGNCSTNCYCYHVDGCGVFCASNTGGGCACDGLS